MYVLCICAVSGAYATADKFYYRKLSSAEREKRYTDRRRLSSATLNALIQDI